MSILDKAAPPAPEALIVTIVGTPGSGKSSLAATWPNPYLIRTQGEAMPRDLPNPPASIGETTTEELLVQQLTALIREDHPYKSVIIDSVTGLESMFVNEVLNAPGEKAKSINQAAGGYGAGRETVRAKHMRVRRAAEALRKKGIPVVFLAHSDIVTINPPDGDSYTQYSLRLHDKSIAPYVDEVDVVGFLKQETALIGEDRKRAVGGEDRVLVTYLTPANVSKNRLGITDDIPVVKGVNPLEQWINPSAAAEKPKIRVKAKQAEEVKPVADDAAEDVDVNDYVEG